MALGLYKQSQICWDIQTTQKSWQDCLWPIDYMHKNQHTRGTSLRQCGMHGAHYAHTCMTKGTVSLKTTTTTPSNGLCSRTTWVSQYQKGKTSLDLNEAKDGGVFGCSGSSWTIRKQTAPRSRCITTPTPNHSICTGQMLFPTPNQQCQSTGGLIHTHTHTHTPV